MVTLLNKIQYILREYIIVYGKHKLWSIPTFPAKPKVAPPIGVSCETNTRAQKHHTEDEHTFWSIKPVIVIFW